MGERSRPTPDEIVQYAEELKEVLQESPLPTFSVGADTRVYYANDLACALLGYGPQELNGMSVFDLYTDTPQGKAKAGSVFQRFRSGETIRQVELQMQTKDGGHLSVYLWAQPVFDDSGAVVASRGYVVDVTSLKQGYENKLKTLIQHATDAVFVIDPQTERILEVNEATCDMLEYSRDELIGMPAADVHPDEMERLREFFGRTAADTYAWTSELTCTTRSGAVIPSETSGLVLEVDEQQVIVAIVRDIRERRASEQRIADLLRQKEIMLGEIHHRVRNNLAVVESLLSIQSMSVDDPGARRELEVSRLRIHAMATVHEHLYEDEKLQWVRFDRIARQLVATIGETLEESGQHIAVELALDTVWLALSQAVPCGLVLNELVSDSYLNYFAQRVSGTLSVRLGLSESRRLELTVATDEPEEELPAAGAGWARIERNSIVPTLAAQLGGEIRRTADAHGVSVTFAFVPQSSGRTV